MGRLMSEELKCPKCGGTLEKGYVHAPRGIYWDTKKHAWSVMFTEELVSNLAFPSPIASGLRCETCKIVLFYY